MQNLLRDRGDELTALEREQIQQLLRRIPPHIHDELEQIWYLMDIVWDEFGCDNKKLNWDNIDKFYRHPVWLLNGLFVEHHELSMQHREAISEWVTERGEVSKILDYGGGAGTLAVALARKKACLQVDIYEPHPMEYAIRRVSSYSNVRFVNHIPELSYDALVSTDVLEHVPDPLKVFGEMITAVKRGGYLIIANNFYPVIKCHLPRTFHLRYTFNLFARLMGLVVVGPLHGSHATVFRKVSCRSAAPLLVRSFEMLSMQFFWLASLIKPVVRPLRNCIGK